MGLWFWDTLAKSEGERINCNMTDVINCLGLGTETANMKWKDAYSLEDKLWLK